MKEWLFILIPVALVQFFVPMLEIQLALYVALGFFFAFYSNLRYAFLKAFLAEFVVMIIIYVLNLENNAFISQVFETLKLPVFLAPVAFVLINALNVAFCFQIGFSLRQLFNNKKKKKH